MTSMNELQTIDGYCDITKTGLTFKRDVSKEEWQFVFDACNHISGCIQFWIGDLLKYREQKWGMYDDVVEQTGIDKNTLRQYKQISEQVKSDTRVSALGYAHHREVASLPEPKQIEYLTRASEQKLSVRDLRAEIRREKYNNIHEAIMPDGKYRVVYADPPWKYGNEMPSYVTVPEDYYPSMSISELCDMPIDNMTQDNAVLFMWVTSPLLEECFQVIRAWGFKYKTSFVWDKVKHNMGHYNSVRHELLLVCTKGSCTPDVLILFDSVLSIERTEHSKKPEKFRDIIDTIYPHGNRIELFARAKTKNWQIYGNQIVPQEQ
jgi:N6-adenosine-specific RNA methylase IME4